MKPYYRKNYFDSLQKTYENNSRTQPTKNKSRFTTKIDLILMLSGLTILILVYVLTNNPKPTSPHAKVSDPIVRDLTSENCANNPKCNEGKVKYVVLTMLTELRRHAGQFECISSVKKNVMNISKLKPLFSCNEDVFKQALEWLLRERNLGVSCLTELGEEANHVGDIWALTSRIAHKPLWCRIYFAVCRMLYCFMLLICVFLTLVAVKFWRRKTQKESETVGKLALDIIDFLKKRSLKARNEPSVSPSVPLLHIRDELIKLEDRAGMKGTWMNAHKLIETHETRVKQSIELIHGEEFVTLTWIGDEFE